MGSLAPSLHRHTGTLTPIAIVDDSDEFRYFVSLLVEQELGVACVSAASLAEVEALAPQVLATRLILVDINLGPGTPDGVAVVEWLRARNYRGKVFFFTGHAQGSPQVEKALQTGVRILEKPMPSDDIVQILREVIEDN